MHYVVCLFTYAVTLVLTAPSHEGMARLSRSEWLILYQDGFLPALRRLPNQVLTGPGVVQLC